MPRWFTNFAIIPGLDSATIAWKNVVIANGGSVSDARLDIVDTFIIGLRSDGVWAKLDRLSLYAAENQPSALVELVAAGVATAVNSPTFTPNIGFTFNGSSNYLSTGYNPNTNGIALSLNSASLHVWDITNVAASNEVVIGCSDGSNILDIAPNHPSGGVLARINNAFTSVFRDPGAYDGLLTGNRSSSSSVQVYRNGAQVGTAAADNSSAIPSFAIFVGARNDSGGAGGFVGTSIQVAASAMGGNLSATDMTNFYSRLRTYMTAVGVP